MSNNGFDKSIFWDMYMRPILKQMGANIDWEEGRKMFKDTDREEMKHYTCSPIWRILDI